MKPALRQKFFGRLRPDPRARPVDTLLQGQDVFRLKPARAVSDRDGTGNPGRAQAFGIVFGLPAQFPVPRPHSASQDVIGDIKHVITLVIGQMDLEQVPMPVNLFHQAQALGQGVDGPQPATTNRPVRLAIS